MATFTGQKAKNNTFTGTAGADTFRWAFADLDRLDRAVGAGGVDVLQLTTGGPLASTALTGISGIEQIALSKAGNSVTLLNANFAGVAGARIVVTGGAGNDTVDGSKLTGTNRIEVIAGLGTDVLKGGAGADVFRFTAAGLTASDQVSGGGGRDALAFLTGGGPVAGALAKVTGVETIQFSKAGNTIALTNANFTGVLDNKVTVLGGAGNDTVDASALTGTKRIDVTAGLGTDVLKGGTGADAFRFTALGLTGSDQVSGGGGRDTLAFLTGGAFVTGALAQVTGVETLQLSKSGNTLAFTNASFTGVLDNKITVLGGAGNDGVDGSALTGTRRIDVTAGLGADVLKGGAGRDVFRFTVTGLAGDTVIGGGGTDLLRLTTAGTLTAAALAKVSGVESIALAAGTTAITLKDANFAGVTDLLIKVAGGSGTSSETVDASMLTGTRRIEVTAGGGLDTLKGGAGDDTFFFNAADLAGDTVAGGSGYDLVILRTAGALGIDALAHMTGIDEIDLAAGGNTLTLTDANYAVESLILVSGSTGNSVIDAVDLTGDHRITVYNNGGGETVFGGDGDDQYIFAAGASFGAGDSFDGGGGTDNLVFDQSMNFLGDSITNVEALSYIGNAAASVTVSGANAARLQAMGSTNVDGVATFYTVELAAGSSTDLSKLTLVNADAADAINVIGLGGAGTSTSVTLSAAIAGFTGGAGNDAVGLAPDGTYKSGAAIDGGGGDDRIAYQENSGSTVDGGVGNDTLVVFENEVIDLRNVDHQEFPGTSRALNFENVDGSGSTADLDLTGRDDVISVLIGGIGDDSIQAGVTGAVITGGLGADLLVGNMGDDRFRIFSGEEALSDNIDGGGGSDGIDLFASTDLTGTTITNIQTLYLAAGDTAGNFTNAHLTATLTGTQAAGFTDIFGNGFFTDSTETLVINANSTELDVSGLGFSYWGAGDTVVINGTNGNDTITGTSANDVIHGGGGKDSIHGGDGDDAIGYIVGPNGQDSYGDAGNDTLVLTGHNANSDTALVRIDLQSGLAIEYDQNFILNGSPQSCEGIENVDFSQNLVQSDLRGGDDDNVLIGGSASDELNGRFGADTLTGNGGADSFVWNTKLEGGDTITDFESGLDKLVFKAADFAVDGLLDNFAFNTLGSTGDITGIDILAVGDRFNSVGEVRAYLDTQETTRDHGMFLVAQDSSGAAIVYYTANAASSAANNAVFEIANLGSNFPVFEDFMFG